MRTVPDFDTVIVGAGFSGIGAAIQLDKAGLGDYLVIEAGDGPGGTWYWNTYPGVAVDIPSFSYQFSFEQSPSWSRTYARGHELKAYAEHCVDKYGLDSKIRFKTEVLGADFDDAEDLWHIRTDPGGVVTARFLVNASGVFIVPNMPDIDGVDSFAGATIHTARWDHDQDLTHKRVAIIGTGASAVQVIPEIAPIVKHLTVFQRLGRNALRENFFQPPRLPVIGSPANVKCAFLHQPDKASAKTQEIRRPYHKSLEKLIELSHGTELGGNFQQLMKFVRLVACPCVEFRIGDGHRAKASDRRNQRLLLRGERAVHPRIDKNCALCTGCTQRRHNHSSCRHRSPVRNHSIRWDRSR